jgi:hypothetical protein
MEDLGERLSQAVEEESIDGKPDPPEPLIALVPEDSPEPTSGDERNREWPSLVDMLFREAEVIAQNLKESGTRR